MAMSGMMSMPLLTTGSRARRRPSGRPRGRSRHRLLLAALLLFGQLLRVAPRALRVGLHLELQEARTQRLDLLADRLADVVAGYGGAQAARRGDRLQPGHPRAQHEHARRLDGP